MMNKKELKNYLISSMYWAVLVAWGTIIVLGLLFIFSMLNEAQAKGNPNNKYSMERACKSRSDPSVRQRIFMECLTLASEARKGTSYTTNDDEDFDEVIKACENAAYYQAKTFYCPKGYVPPYSEKIIIK